MRLPWRRPWPTEPRLKADDATVERWDQIRRAERLRFPLRAASVAARRLGREMWRSIRGDERKFVRRDGRSRPALRSENEWGGSAAVAVAATSRAFRSKLPLARRAVPSDLVAGLVDGWLHVSRNTIDWYAGRSTGATSAVVIHVEDIASIEAVELGRRSGGLTITTIDTDELWLLVDDRRKLEGILGALRYGSAS